MKKPNLILAGFAVAMFALLFIFAMMWKGMERKALQPQTSVDTIIVSADTAKLVETKVKFPIL